MARRAPAGTPARRLVWVYTLHLDPPYPSPPCENGHQVGHYTGIAPGLLSYRLGVQESGGPRAARLLQVQKAAGGTFHLVSVERGTQDRETELKYRGASRRCSMCKAGTGPAAGPDGEPGWVLLLHLDRARARRAYDGQHRQMTHWTGFLPGTGTEALYAALEQGGRGVAEVLQLPDPGDGTWRLVSAERGTRARLAWYSEARAGMYCPPCIAARRRARALAVLAAIERGEVANRCHPVKGWAARWYVQDGQPVLDRGPGGELGRNVTITAHALVRRGLAIQTRDPAAAYPLAPSWPPADRPYLVTAAGEAMLRKARAPRFPGKPRPPGPATVLARRVRAGGLPVTRDGRLSLSRMTDEQRDRAGLMTRAMARQHRELCTLDHPRRAERILGLAPPDEWTVPAPPACPVPASTTTPRKNAGQTWPGTDPSWPSTVTDGVAAAISKEPSRVRQVAASRSRARRNAGTVAR